MCFSKYGNSHKAARKATLRILKRLWKTPLLEGVTLNHLSWDALLGTPTALLSLQGEDSNGEIIREKMRQIGVSTELLQVSSDYSTPVSHIYVDESGERMILMATGSSLKISTLIFDLFFESAVRKAAMVIAEVCQVPLKTILRMFTVANEAKVPSFLDIDVPPSVAIKEAGLGSLKELIEAARSCSVLKPTMDAALELISTLHSGGEIIGPRDMGASAESPETVALKLLQALNGPCIVVVANSSKGSGFAMRTKGADISLSVPAHPGVKQVDATGAGDAFFGGLVSTIYHLGFPSDISELKRLGLAAGALGAACVQVLGALPTVESGRQAKLMLPKELQPFIRTD